MGLDMQTMLIGEGGDRSYNYKLEWSTIGPRMFYFKEWDITFFKCMGLSKHHVIGQEQ
jgi:hypothetical protein